MIFALIVATVLVLLIAFTQRDKLPFASNFTQLNDKLKGFLAPFKSLLQDKKPEKFVEPTTKIEFRLIKGGCFILGDTFGDGDSDERPTKEVCLNDFYIATKETTQEQWLRVMKNNPSTFKDPLLPVDNVNIKDIEEFLAVLNKNDTNFKYTLPSEVQWEYACRSGGKNQKYSGTSKDDELKDYAWFGANSAGKPHPVGTLKPNALGLFDLSGNVWEWTDDDYNPDCYKSISKDNPVCKGNAGNKVIRGGSWSLSERFCRCSARRGAVPLGKANNVGFRLVAYTVKGN